MSNSVTTINFAFADGTTKSYSMGPFAVSSASVLNFKNRVQSFNSADAQEQKKFTNLFDAVKSDNGAAVTGVKSATITTSQTQRIFDASTYTP